MPCRFDGGVDDALQIGIAIVQIEQFRIAIDIFADFLLARFLWDHGGGAVDQAEVDIEGAPDIADGGFGAHGAEGDDGGDLVLAVFLRGVGDHLAAAIIGIIEIDIGHGDAPGVEEALEEQAVLYRVDIGDAEAVGDQAGGARPADIPPDIGLAGEFAKVPNDQEIGVEAHTVDDVELALDALGEDVVSARQSRVKAPLPCRCRSGGAGSYARRSRAGTGKAGR